MSKQLGVCECGKAATVKSRGALTCEGCRDMEIPKKREGIKVYQSGKSNAHINWERYHLYKDEGPIAGGSLVILDELMKKLPCGH